MANFAYSNSLLPRVDIVLPGKNKSLENIINKISENNNFTVRQFVKKLPPVNDQGDILLLISDNLLPLLKESQYKANFALYVNSKKFNSMNINNSSAVYSDQPLNRQLELISALFRSRKINVGMVYKNNEYNIELRKLIKNHPNLIFDIESIDGKNILRTTNKIIQSNDVILATPESEIYNSQNIRSLLLSSYRHQTVFIGPSESFVKAGALASVMSNPDQYSLEIITMLTEYIKRGMMPKSRFPNQYTVIINNNFAKSLGLQIPDIDYLHNQIMEKESP
jgi:ABC-type uncharacterized transport system substrate-binding protein